MSDATLAINTRRLILALGVLLIASAAAAREMTSAYVVTAAANKSGLNGTYWITDLTMFNPQEHSLPVAVALLKTGEDNRDALTGSVVLGPYETVNALDVIGTSFSSIGTTGALLVWVEDDFWQQYCQGGDAGNCDFAVFTRTYTPGFGGTFGQAVPGFPANLGLDQTVYAYLPQLIENAEFRTNIGIASWTDAWVQVRVDLQDRNGDVVDRRDHWVPPFSHIQPTHLPVTLVGGTAQIYIINGPADAMVYPYASVIDNRTGDAVNVEAQITPVGAVVTGASAMAVRPARGTLRAPAGRPERIDLPDFEVRVRSADR